MMCKKCGQPQFFGGAGYAGRQCLCVGLAILTPVQPARDDLLTAEIERLKLALTWIATVKAMDYEYQAKARAVLGEA